MFSIKILPAKHTNGTKTNQSLQAGKGKFRVVRMSLPRFIKVATTTGINAGLAHEFTVWQKQSRMNPKTFFGELKRRNVYTVVVGNSDFLN